MFKNYLKIAFRNIVRHKAFAAINIIGLAIGMACSIFILLWVQNEKSYDRFHIQIQSGSIWIQIEPGQRQTKRGNRRQSKNHSRFVLEAI